MRGSAPDVASFGNERSLHSAVKSWVAQPGDRFEVNVDGFIVDVVRGDLLIEVQTRNFSAIRAKLETLVKTHRVRLVYPLTTRKTIIHLDASNGSPTKRRLSPKKGRLIDLFNEVAHIPRLCREQNFELQVLMVEEEETRLDDGRGSWRRGGASIKDHSLVNVTDTATFSGVASFAALLPKTLPQPFTNRQLATNLKTSPRTASLMTYALREMGVLQIKGKTGRAHLFQTPP